MSVLDGIREQGVTLPETLNPTPVFPSMGIMLPYLKCIADLLQLLAHVCDHIVDYSREVRRLLCEDGAIQYFLIGQVHLNDQA